MVAEPAGPAKSPAEPAPWTGWALVGIVALVIATASLVPIPEGAGDGVPGNGLPALDKLGHLIAHGLLALTVWRALAPARRTALALPAFLALVAYGLLLELLQVPVPTRAFQPLDLVANVLGASLLLLLARPWAAEHPRA